MKFTVFTPTYNRADKLARVYQSLLVQKNKDFEWLLVNDGSTDNSDTVIKNFIKEDKLNIRYIKKENGGKHTAYNIALLNAEGDYFLCLDSDDYLTDNAIDTISNALHTPRYGLIGYKANQSMEILSSAFPKQLKGKKINLYNLNSKGCKGEFVLVFPTNLAKKYLFPVFEGEKFVTESIVYDQLDEECVYTVMPEILMICEYQKDGYTNSISRLMKNNPNAYAMYFAQRMDREGSIIEKLMNAGKYCCFRMLEKKQIYKYSGNNKGIVAIAYPLGFMFFLYYRLIRNI